MRKYTDGLADAGPPLAIEPDGDPRPEALVEWLEANADAVRDDLRRHGALSFRRFAIHEPEHFEAVARIVAPDLKNEYMGTSPREALTDYVFSASELPGYYPIPQHLEMSFIADPPKRLFFWCRVAPAPGGGETPLVDFRKVYADLDDGVRDRFDQGGIRIVRNYGPPGRRSRDLWQLKPWDEIFGSTDREIVEGKCEAEGFTPFWRDDGGLRLESTQPASWQHPETGERVWANHVQVFHLSTAPSEYRRIARLRPRLRYRALARFARVMVGIKRRTTASDGHAMHCTYADGSEIPAADLEHVRDVIWDNLVLCPWRRGDVVAIDNRSVAHGRMPYTGPRDVAVCWA